MEQVKIFWERINQSQTLENEINAWLKEMAGKIEVRERKQSMQEHQATHEYSMFLVITIFYEELQQSPSRPD